MLYAMLAATAGRHPRANAIVQDGRTVTFAELLTAVDGFAARLAGAGIGGSDRVVLLLPNSREFIVSVFALAKIGGIIVPLNPQYQEPELQYYFRDCLPKAVITRPGLADACSRIIDSLALRCPVLTSTDGVRAKASLSEASLTGLGQTAANLEVLYQYSAGSTGVPKRVTRTQANLVAEASNFVATAGLGSDDRILTVVPLFHAHGFGNCLLASARSGAAVVVLQTFQRARVVEALTHEHITIFPGVPFMFSILAASPFLRGLHFPALRLAFSAGAALPREAFEGFNAKFGVAVRQLYGSTETGSVSINLGPCTDDLWASVGLPIHNVEVLIADAEGRPVETGQVGEILVRSPAMTTGYAGLPDISRESFRDGYFWSGDRARRDSRGNLFITGRKTLFINIGGYKVDPVEVENVLNAHPGVSESVVLGVMGHQGRELVKAVIVPREECTAQQIQDWCSGKISDYKIPRIVEFRHEIPRSPLGKILRKYLDSASGEP